jgi:Lysosomal transcription factor, NCU-G1
VTTIEDCNSMMLVYVQAESDSNIIHYLWDFTGYPSILIAHTDKNASLKVNWDIFKDCSSGSRCVEFTKEPKYVFSSVIKNIVVFNDTNDAGNYSDESVVDSIKFDPHDDLHWKKINLTESNGQFAKLEMSAFTKRNETFSLNVSNIYLNFSQNFLCSLVNIECAQ